MRITVFTLFPEWFAGPFDASLLGRARAAGLLDLRCVNFRDFAHDRHRTVDDEPYGGGPGMVLKPEPIVESFEAHPPEGRARRVYLTPWGRPFRHADARAWAELDELQLLCGRYEGVDERVIEGWIDDCVSIGDFVLSGGEAAAACVVEAVSRFVPGVLGDAESLEEESFSHGLLEGPQYTRPPEFRGRGVPEVLSSGHHARIADWRLAQAEARTRQWRPDLWAAHRAGTGPGDD